MPRSLRKLDDGATFFPLALQPTLLARSAGLRSVAELRAIGVPIYKIGARRLALVSDLYRAFRRLERA
jgi:hypothetical protein